MERKIVYIRLKVDLYESDDCEYSSTSSSIDSADDDEELPECDELEDCCSDMKGLRILPVEKNCKCNSE